MNLHLIQYYYCHSVSFQVSQPFRPFSAGTILSAEGMVQSGPWRRRSRTWTCISESWPPSRSWGRVYGWLSRAILVFWKESRRRRVRNSYSLYFSSQLTLIYFSSEDQRSAEKELCIKWNKENHCQTIGVGIPAISLRGQEAWQANWKNQCPALIGSVRNIFQLFHLLTNWNCDCNLPLFANFVSCLFFGGEREYLRIAIADLDPF